MKKVPCNKCGTMILPRTATDNNKMCVPCRRSEEPIGKFVGHLNRIFGPFLDWVNDSSSDSKPGKGCLLLPLLVISFVFVSILYRQSQQERIDELPAEVVEDH